MMNLLKNDTKDLNSFYLIMQDIVEFCYKSITETNSAVEITEGKVVSTTTVAENKNMDAKTKNQETHKQHLKEVSKRNSVFLNTTK